MSKYAILYCRVSDQNQVDKGHSIKEQEPMLREFAASQGYKVLQVFTDKAKSATTTVGRDELDNMLEYVKHQKLAKQDGATVALFVQDTDRLARDEVDHFGIRAFLKKHNVKLISKNQPGINESIEGQLQDTIMAGVNAFQSRMTGRKVSDMKERMVAQGKTTHKAPIGYINVNKGTHDMPKREVELDPTTYTKVRKIFENYATGSYTLQEVANKANEEGLVSKNGNPLQRSTVEHILKSPYYTGQLRYKGQLKPGIHPKLIDDVLFERCRQVLTEHGHYAIRKRVPENHAKFFLKPFLCCAICGYQITGEGATGRNKKKYDYYRCIRPKGDKKYHSNRGNCSDVLTIEAQIETLFSMFILGDSIIQEVLERAREILSETHGEIDAEKLRLDAQIKRLEKRRQNLETKWLDGEFIQDDSVYHRNHKIIEDEIMAAQKRIAEISQDRKDNTKLFEGLVKLARNLPDAYTKTPPEVKKMYLTVFWDYFEIAKHEVTKAVPSKAVAALINEKLITLKDNTPQTQFLISRIWLPRLDSNQ